MKARKLSKRIREQLSDTKHINKSILSQYGVIIAIWVIVTFAMLLLFSLYTYEMTKIYNMDVEALGQVKSIEEWKKALPDIALGKDQQTVYKAMVLKVFGDSGTILQIGRQIPIVWFSCMLFIPNFTSVSNWQTVWENKMENVTTTQIYILISQILALIGLIYYIYLVSSYAYKMRKANKLHFTNRYPLYLNDIGLYSQSIYSNFIIAVSIFFSFFGLSTALIMLVYMLIMKAIYKKIDKTNKENGFNVNLFKSEDLSYFKTLIAVMVVMILYNAANSFITSWLNVDVSAALKGLFSTGGIAVVIFSLVRSVLANNITEVRRKVKNINKQIEELRFFYDIRKGEAAFDFEYAQKIPPVIKELIVHHKNIGSKAINESFKKLLEYTDFIQNFNFKKKHSYTKGRKSFILYRMYNEITTFDEIEDIKINLLKEYNINA